MKGRVNIRIVAGIFLMSFLLSFTLTRIVVHPQPDSLRKENTFIKSFTGNSDFNPFYVEENEGGEENNERDTDWNSKSFYHAMMICLQAYDDITPANALDCLQQKLQHNTSNKLFLIKKEFLI